MKNLFHSISLFYKLASSLSLDEILDQLSNLETFKDKIDFAEKHLEHLSSGSSRIIYLTPKKEVLKLAKNERGIAQNKVEAQDMGTKFINKTIKADKNGSWKISPFLDKITAKEFEKLTDMSFEEFGNAISYGLKAISDNSDKEKPNNFEEIFKSDIYKEVVAVGKKFKLLGGDIARISSWGMMDDHPVLLDSGLTKDIFDTYYRSDEKKTTK